MLRFRPWIWTKTPDTSELNFATVSPKTEPQQISQNILCQAIVFKSLGIMPTSIKIKTPPTQLNLTLGFKIVELPNSTVPNSHVECSAR
jgi:hypothetical protein